MLRIKDILDKAVDQITNIIETEYANKYRGQHLTKELLDRIAIDVHMYLCDQMGLDPHKFSLRIHVAANDFGLVRIEGVPAYLKASLRG